MDKRDEYQRSMDGEPAEFIAPKDFSSKTEIQNMTLEFNHSTKAIITPPTLSSAGESSTPQLLDPLELEMLIQKKSKQSRPVDKGKAAEIMTAKNSSNEIEFQKLIPERDNLYKDEIHETILEPDNLYKEATPSPKPSSARDPITSQPLDSSKLEKMRQITASTKCRIESMHTTRMSPSSFMAGKEASLTPTFELSLPIRTRVKASEQGDNILTALSVAPKPELAKEQPVSATSAIAQLPGFASTFSFSLPTPAATSEMASHSAEFPPSPSTTESTIELVVGNKKLAALEEVQAKLVGQEQRVKEAKARLANATSAHGNNRKGKSGRNATKAKKDATKALKACTDRVQALRTEERELCRAMAA